jgi:hypothetical protein
MGKVTRCLEDHDHRIRTIEIEGSSKAEEALVTVGKLTVRVAAVEKICNSDQAVDLAQTNWWDSIYAKAGILTGIALGIAAVIMDVLR